MDSRHRKTVELPYYSQQDTGHLENDIDQINPILRDRITEIQTNGFKSKEKIQIIRHSMWENITNKVQQPNITISDETLEYLIDYYTKNICDCKRKEPKYKDCQGVYEETIFNSEDIFDRGHKLKKIEIDNKFPNFIVNNKDKFSRWII